MEPVPVGRSDQIQRNQSRIHRQKNGEVNPEVSGGGLPISGSPLAVVFHHLLSR